MKGIKTLFSGLVLATLMSFAAPAEAKDLKVAVVDFRQCAENSRLGKQEQRNFEGLKQQIQGSIAGKEKELNELSEKFNDADYLDSLSPEAEQELREKVRRLTAEYQQIQAQLYQTLNQINYQFVQKMGVAVAESAESLAKSKGYDLVINSEGAFYFSNSLDLTQEVISEMNKRFESLQDKEDGANAS